jgi:hypothetical protein
MIQTACSTHTHPSLDDSTIPNNRTERARFISHSTILAEKTQERIEDKKSPTMKQTCNGFGEFVFAILAQNILGSVGDLSPPLLHLFPQPPQPPPHSERSPIFCTAGIWRRTHGHVLESIASARAIDKTRDLSHLSSNDSNEHLGLILAESAKLQIIHIQSRTCGAAQAPSFKSLTLLFMLHTHLLWSKWSGASF